MAADIHAVALVLHRARDATDRFRRLQYDRPHSAIANKFQRRGKPCRPGTDNNDCWLHAWHPILKECQFSGCVVEEKGNSRGNQLACEQGQTPFIDGEKYHQIIDAQTDEANRDIGGELDGCLSA